MPGEDERVFDLSIDPPEIVCIDTSAAVAMVFGDQLGHDAYLDFLARAVDAQTKLIYSELLDLELAQVCVKAARGRHDGRRQASIRTGKQLIRDVFERWNILISQTQSDRISLAGGDGPYEIGSPVRAAAFHLIEEFGIESYDATHAGTAIVHGAPILTSDQGFTDVPAGRLDIITHSGVLAGFRERRGRA